MSSKSVAKKMKEAGLKRLRWYCQMCEKQCRDENGFKNHCLSEGHLRKMKEFSENAAGFMDKFSSIFEKSYMDILSHRHLTNRVNANLVYQELIRDKNHVHMNATMWSSLAQFVRYLGASGKCHVEETEEGWFIRYIDPTKRMEEEERRQKEESQHASKSAKERVKAMRAENLKVSDFERNAVLENEQEEEEEDHKRRRLNEAVVPSLFDMDENGDAEGNKNGGVVTVPDNVFDNQEATQEEEETPFAFTGLVVRIVSSKVKAQDGRSLKHEKCIVVDVDPNTNNVELISAKTGESILNVKQKYLETVIPAIGGGKEKKKKQHGLTAPMTEIVIVSKKIPVLFKRKGTVVKINEKNEVGVKLIGEQNGNVRWFYYMDVCKLEDV